MANPSEPLPSSHHTGSKQDLPALLTRAPPADKGRVYLLFINLFKPLQQIPGRSHLEGKEQVPQHPSWGHPSLLEPPEGAACSLTAPGASSPSFPLARSRRCLPVPGSRRGCGAAVRAAGASPAPGKHRELGDNPTPPGLPARPLPSLPGGDKGSLVVTAGRRALPQLQPPKTQPLVSPMWKTRGAGTPRLRGEVARTASTARVPPAPQGDSRAGLGCKGNSRILLPASPACCKAGGNGLELGAAHPCCSALTHGTPGPLPAH